MDIIDRRVIISIDHDDNRINSKSCESYTLGLRDVAEDGSATISGRGAVFGEEDDMSLFRLGIIGGYLSHQKGIPLSQLYHRQLGRLLEIRDDIRLKVYIAHEFDLDPVERLNELLGRTAVDGVLFHLRNVFVRKAGIVVAFKRDGIRHRVLHPFLFRRGHGTWEELEARQFDTSAPIIRQLAEPLDEHNITPTGRTMAGIRFRDINYLLGKIVGLDTWAIEDELRILDRFLNACRERKVPVFVMGPTPMAASPMKDALCTDMGRVLNERTARHGVSCCTLNDLAGNGPAIQTADGRHMTAEGHRVIAEKLYAPISGWIKKHHYRLRIL